MYNPLNYKSERPSEKQPKSGFKGAVSIVLFILSLLIGLGRGARVAVKSQRNSSRAQVEDDQRVVDDFKKALQAGLLNNEQPRRPFD